MTHLSHDSSIASAPRRSRGGAQTGKPPEGQRPAGSSSDGGGEGWSGGEPAFHGAEIVAARGRVKHAVAMGGARGVKAGAPMNTTASFDARAKAQGYMSDPETGDLLKLYHGTNREISPGFLLDPPERATTAATADTGMWASNQPEVARLYAEAASQRGGSQNILPLRARSTRVAEIRLEPGMTELEMKGAILDAWDQGHDAVRVSNFTTDDGSAPAVNWVFKNPNQLRVPWANFDRAAPAAYARQAPDRRA